MMSGIKLWVDDERPAPEGWETTISYVGAIWYLVRGTVVEISLDHDLGEQKTGYDIVCFIEKLVHKGYIPLPIIHCHSANPVGRARIEQAAKNMIERFFA